MSNTVKMDVIKQVADSLGIVVEIERGDGVQPEVRVREHKNKRATFSIDGRESFNKRNAVFEVIKRFLDENPEVTIEDIHVIFPRELQGGYGVIASEDEYNRRLSWGQDPERRYAIDRTLFDSESRKFFVCNQWGDNFERFQRHVKDILG